ncbi:MAG: beta strand repeat-containing protein, partial [Gaiellaceae bacterium]
GGRNADANNGGGGLTIGAAMTLLESENRAAAWLDEGARVAADALTVTSLAEVRPRAAAVATAAGPTSGTAIGGAIVWAKYANQATSFVGYNAVVDVVQAVALNATATFAAPYAIPDPALALGGVGDTYADANAVAGDVAAAFDALSTALAPSLADPAKVGTSYVHASSGTGSGSAFSGGVNYLELFNAAATGVAPGAGVEAGDLVMNAVSTLEAAAVSGLESALSLPAGPPTTADTAGGGYFGGVFAESYARAYIDDRAIVSVARDIAMDTLTRTNLLNVAKQGQTGTGLAINGVFAFVTLDHESIAFIEDRATVAAGRDIDLAAENKNLIVNVAGAQALGGTDAVGVAVAVTVIGTADEIFGSPETLEDRAELDDDGELLGVASVRAFIGDAQRTVGAGGTGGIVGSVSAGRDLKLTATSDPAANEIWTLAVAGAGSSTQPAGSADLSAPGDSANNVDVSAAGSGAINVVDRRTLAYVRDVKTVQVGGHLRLEAQDAAFLAASAGSTIGAGNDTIGASFALNSVTPEARAFTSFVAIEADDVSLIAGSSMTLLSFETTALTGGGSGLAIALSFNLSLVNADVEAGFGEGTTLLVVTGDVTISAASVVDVIAVAGTAAFAAGGGFGVGAALALVIVDSSALAYPGIDIDTAGNVSVSASSDVRSRAFSAVNGSTATSAATTAPGGQVVVVIITSDADASIVDVSIGAAAVTIAATSAIRSTAEAIGDASHVNGAKDAAIATSFVFGTATAKLSGATPVTATGALSISADNSAVVTTTGNAGTAQVGAGIAIAIVELETDAFVDSSAPVGAASVLVSAETESDVTTTGSASKGGAEANDETPMERTDDNAQTEGGDQIAVAGALAFTKLDGDTDAYIASNVTTTGEQRIHARGSHSSKANADGSAATGSPGVGIAIAIALADVSTRAYVAGSASLVAGSIVLEAFNESGATFEIVASSGVSPSSGTVVAGSFALHVLTTTTSALLVTGSTVALTGGDASMTATSESSSTVKALPTGTVGSGFGLGASIALNIVEDVTSAGLEDDATLTGAGDLTIIASSDDAMVTEAEAGVSSSTAIAAAIAISISNVTTTARIGSGTALSIAGDLSADAEQSATVATTAKGAAASTGTGIGAAFALTYATHSVTAVTDRDVAAGGSVTFAAAGYSSSSANTVASASGAPESASGDVTSQANDQRTYGNERAAANGASGATTPANPPAETSEGGISVAAAISINLVTSTAAASIRDGISVTAGGGALTLDADGETDASASADGAAATNAGGTAVGAGVAINLATARVDASIGVEATVSSVGAALSASTGGPSGSGANNTNTFSAGAASGAGGGDLGVAGSFALNIVDLKTTSLLRFEAGRGPPSLDANGSAVSLSATSASTSTATALPKDAAVTGASLGIGASVALNLVDDAATAALQAESLLTEASDLTLRARAEHAMATTAKTGAASAEVAVAPAVAVAISNVSSSATIGVLTGGTLTMTGKIDAKAELTASALTEAEGGAEAADAAVGVAIALTFADHSTTSSTARSLAAGGAVSFQALGSSVATSKATASAAGAPGAGQPGAPAGGVNGQVQGERDQADSQAPGNGSGSTATPSAEDSSGTGISVGAAIAITIALSSSTASAPSGLTVVAGGALTVRSSANSDASTLADGTAESAAGTAIGVGIAITYAEVVNSATLGASAASEGATVEAVMTNAGDLEHQLSAEGKSGASAGDIGVAGSFALGIFTITTSALLLPGSSLDADGNDDNAAGDDVLIRAESTAVSFVKALPAAVPAMPVPETVGIGASIAIAIVNDHTLAAVQLNADVTDGDDLTLRAKGSHALTTAAETGAASASVAIAPAVAVAIHNVSSKALVQGSATAITIAGALDALAEQAASAVTSAKGGSQADEAAIGVAIALTFADHDTEASTARSIGAGGAVSFQALASSTASATSTASAEGAPGDGDAGAPAGGVNGQIAGERAAADGQAPAGGGSGATDEPSAEDSSGTGVSVGAAISLTIALSSSLASVADGVTISAGGALTLRSSASSDAASAADGTASSAEGTAIGVGVAITYAEVLNRAIFGDADATAIGVTVEAVTAGEHELSAEAKSGASAGDIGVAGSFALGIYTITTSGLIESGANVDAGGGNVSLKAESAVTAKVEALPAEDTSGPTPESVGIGASIAIAIVNDHALAAIENDAVLTGAADLALHAEALDALTTTARTGAASAEVAVAPAVAVAIHNVSSRTLIGSLSSAGTLVSSGAVDAKAELTASAVTVGSGDAEGDDAAVGVAIALTFADHDAESTTLRSLTATGAISFQALGSSIASASSTASAAGAPGEGDAGAPAGGVNGQIAGERAAADGQAPAGGGSGATDEPSAEDSSGTGVSVGAAISLTIALSSSVASFADGITVIAGGAIVLRSSANSDAASAADGTAASAEGTAIGVGIAIAYAEVVNLADFGDVTASSEGATVEAVMTDVSGNGEHTFGAEAKSGASAGDIGVAGSFALGIYTITTTAVIPTGASLDADANDDNAATDDVVLNAVSLSSSKVEALPAEVPALPVPESVGVGASIAIAIVNDRTSARIENDALVTDAADLTLSAKGVHGTTTTARTGAASAAVAVAPAVAVAIHNVSSRASIGTQTGTLAVTGTIDATAELTASIVTTAEGGAEADDAAVGVAIALTFADHDAESTTLR